MIRPDIGKVRYVNIDRHLLLVAISNMLTCSYSEEINLEFLHGAGGDVIRRRNIQYGEETVEVDRFHYNDPLGTAKEQGEPERGGA